MNSSKAAFTFLCALSLCGSIWAREYNVQTVSNLPEGVDSSIAEQLEPDHIKIVTDDESTLCEIWLARSWKTTTLEEAAEDEAPVYYPLLPGSLIGVVHVAAPCYDLRQQEIPVGVYTLRYAVQPTFEAHRDTHESRDFLILLSPDDDDSPETIDDPDQLIGWSAEAVGAPHPAFLPLLKARDTTRENLLRTDDRNPDGWVLLLKGLTEEAKKLPLELILFDPV